jgi:hypothetical protein
MTMSDIGRAKNPSPSGLRFLFVMDDVLPKKGPITRVTAALLLLRAIGSFHVSPGKQLGAARSWT